MGAHARSSGALGCPHNSSESGWRSLYAPRVHVLLVVVCSASAVLLGIQFATARSWLSSLMANAATRLIAGWPRTATEFTATYVVVRAEFNLLCTTIGPQVGPGTI